MNGWQLLISVALRLPGSTPNPSGHSEVCELQVRTARNTTKKIMDKFSAARHNGGLSCIGCFLKFPLGFFNVFFVVSGSVA
jgi:hypothetical protein